MRSVHLAVALSFGLVACGGDDGGDVSLGVDASTPIDAAANVDAAPATCTVAATEFGSPTPTTLGAYFKDGGTAGDATDDVVEWLGALESGQPTDVVDVLLYAGYGAFASGAITTGTFQLTGDELNFATCGVCVLLATNLTSNGYDDDYMAVSGTVTITAVPTAIGQPVTGSLSNVQFRHVDIDASTGDTTQAGDSCASAITAVSFNQATTAPPSN